MPTKVMRKNSRLADDIRDSLREARNYASGKPTKAIVHRVSPKETDAREARKTLGLSQDGSRSHEPKAQTSEIRARRMPSVQTAQGQWMLPGS
jgi:hypothetical protein